MKNKRSLLWIILAVVVVAVVVLLLLLIKPQDPITLLKEKLTQVTTVKQATRTIKVLAGTTQLSLQEDTYQVDGSSVSVTTTLTKLNPNYVVDGQLTTTTTLNSTITLQQFHQQIPHTITLTMDDLVAESYSAVENATTITHSMTILPAHVSAFLDISQEQANTVTNLQVTIVEQNDLVTSFVLTYTSTSGNNVTISYSFTY